MPKHITHFTEADYENAIIELFTTQLGYEYVYGPDAVRDTYIEPLFLDRFRQSLCMLNPDLPEAVITDDIRLFNATS